MVTVYRHRRLDTNEVFYVGIGKTEKRAYNKNKRSKFWKKITNKTDYSVEIIAEVDTWEDACELEQFLIQEYGRKNLGTGPLVNMTDGGDGSVGLKHSEEAKQKISEGNKGLKHSEEAKLKMSIAKKGKKSPNAKKVICTKTGKIWESLKDCTIENNLNYTTVASNLNGKTLKNNTTFKYLEVERNK